MLFLVAAFVMLLALIYYFKQTNSSAVTAHAQKMRELNSEKLILQNTNIRQMGQVDLAKQVSKEHNLIHLEISNLLIAVIKDEYTDRSI